MSESHFKLDYVELDYIELTHCLACGENLEGRRPFVSLGSEWASGESGQPLANSYQNSKKEAQDLEIYPLRVRNCPNCDHMQLTHAVNPDLMFKDYAYVSGTSTTMRMHFSWFANYAAEIFESRNQFRATNVLDIGCNDGSQLDAFFGFDTFGVDPASNIVVETRKKGHIVHDGYFDDTFTGMEVPAPFPSTYDILIAQNVFAHNSDPLGFLKSAKQVMTQSSVLLIQTSQADMLLNGEFDTIYHEHINFFCIKSMWELVGRAGMDLVDVVKCPLHGNSYIFTVQLLDDEYGYARPAHIDNLITMEERAGVGNPETYNRFASDAEHTRTYLAGELIRKRRQGYKIVGYGAAAKGMTVLNYVTEPLDFIIDDSPLKQGKYTPGLGIPIYNAEEGFAKIGNIPTLFVVLAWNFYDEIRARIKAKHDNRDDLFLTYFPVGVKVSK